MHFVPDFLFQIFIKKWENLKTVGLFHAVFEKKILKFSGSVNSEYCMGNITPKSSRL